jgi:chorismate mutase/prephenate dehydratase
MTPDGADHRAEIDDLRRRIDEVDRDLVRLLALRLQAAAAIGRLKQEGDVALVDAAREHEVQLRWRAHAALSGVPSALADAVLREILTQSRRVQEPGPQEPGRRIAFQGVSGAYSERAVLELASRDGRADVMPIGFATFDEALAALCAGEVELALLPVENSICGPVTAALGAVAAHRVHAIGEIETQIEHCLVGLPGSDASTLARIRSHPVALSQCRRQLAALAPAEPEEWPDTADAARSVAAERDAAIAAICHEDAGRHHGLVVLRRGMADDPDNRTRFTLFARDPG